jgi:DNA-binding NarL/FixJ family response regulator
MSQDRQPRSTTRTVLIVDDHAGFRAFTRAMLEAEGLVVLGEAEDGKSAIVAARLLKPQVVLLDIALPDLDGFTVCERILTQAADPVVVVLTSTREASSFRQRLSQSRAHGFIAKRNLSGAALRTLAG